MIESMFLGVQFYITGFHFNENKRLIDVVHEHSNWVNDGVEFRLNFL